LEGYKSAIFEEVRLGGFSPNPATAPGFLFMALRWSQRLPKDGLPITSLGNCRGFFVSGEVP
jgi:hypothetical protein